MVWAVALISLGLLIFTLLFGSRLMGIEMIFIFQVAYVGLVMVAKLEALMLPLRHLKIVAGYSGLLPDSSSANLPERFS